MRSLQLLVLFILTLSLSGCEAILTIFEAGVWVGVIGIFIVLAVVGLLFSLFRGR
jgi:hypothetical protein